jgi:hypothetical protein
MKSFEFLKKKKRCFYLLCLCNSRNVFEIGEHISVNYKMAACHRAVFCEKFGIQIIIIMVPELELSTPAAVFL